MRESSREIRLPAGGGASPPRREAGRAASMPAIPLSLYVHLPWCVRKCPYCDFNSRPLSARDDVRGYVRAVLADLHLERQRVERPELVSVFFGGGTPSLLAADQLARLLETIRAEWRLVAECELTLEANPGTADAGRFREYRAAGINRLSIGVQSFHDPSLRRLGRIHGAREAHAAVEAAYRAGFENVNLDVMFGLPDQGVVQALADIETAIRYRPAHISHYELTIEPGTAFERRAPELPSEKVKLEIAHRSRRCLAEAGYRRYEVSAFAQPARRCRHNMNYWQYGDYIGVGAGAHGKLTRCGKAVERTNKHADPFSYVAQLAAGRLPSAPQRLAAGEVVLEFLINALRLADGFSVPLFESRTGLGIDAVEARLAEAARRGLVELSRGKIRASAAGWRYLDDLLLLFVP